ncbi:hypothetical protein [Pseudarthrobacter sp. NamE5]|uniref:hypothetical protein n=1 Tax=Pseudarthrobacter sp. NamE5 TaxID=2576839 RepID=UPI0014863503|nr:hypothetical protein [Pseudarthrobacter sp. NamE5]
MTHPTLSYAGVADWRPARLAAMTADATPEAVREAAEGLQAKRFIFFDEETEEILVRSFLRHDGLLKQPKLSISMVNAYGAIASARIREVVTFELQRLYEEFPGWAAFGQEKVLALVKGKGTDMAEFTLGLAPAVTPLFRVNAAQADPLPTTTTTTTTTTTKKLSRRSPARPLPTDWKPTEAHQRKAREKHLDLELQAETFRNHALANDRRASNWDAAFNNWLIKATPGAAPKPAASSPWSREFHQAASNG